MKTGDKVNWACFFASIMLISVHLWLVQYRTTCEIEGIHPNKLAYGFAPVLFAPWLTGVLFLVILPVRFILKTKEPLIALPLGLALYMAGIFVSMPVTVAVTFIPMLSLNLAFLIGGCIVPVGFLLYALLRTPINTHTKDSNNHKEGTDA